MAVNEIKIKHPQRNNQGNKAVPLTFAAAGTAKGTLTNVTGELFKINKKYVVQGGAVGTVRLLFLKDKPFGDHRFRWVLYCKVDGPGDYLLVVKAKNGAEVLDTDRISFEARAVNLDQGKPKDDKRPEKSEKPIIWYPLEDQNVIDERDYCISYGWRANGSDNTVVSGTVTVEALQVPHDDLYDDSANFWFLQFYLSDYQPDLPDIYFRANNNTLSSDPRHACIIA